MDILWVAVWGGILGNSSKTEAKCWSEKTAKEERKKNRDAALY